MLTQSPLLTAEECSTVRHVVHDLKTFWCTRSARPFYTLGAASYIDAAVPIEQASIAYVKKAKRTNAILRQHFGWLYHRLSTVLAHHLGRPICYHPTFALPGFHIFPAPAQPTPGRQGMRAMHVDIQYQLLNWGPTAEIDFDCPISFTLAITLPQAGGGLEGSNLSYADVMQRTKEQLMQLHLTKGKRFYAYQVGSLVLHSGLLFHQIAPMPNMQPDDEKITLQGHGLLCQGTWNLYW
jgi:hypothetical protein